jgi:hypothetical protein
MNFEQIVNQALTAAQGMTPKSRAAMDWQHRIKFGGPRVFQNWDGQRKHPYDAETSVVRGESYRVPSFDLDPMEHLGLEDY